MQSLDGCKLVVFCFFQDMLSIHIATLDNFAHVARLYWFPAIWSLSCVCVLKCLRATNWTPCACFMWKIGPCGCTPRTCMHYKCVNACLATCTCCFCVGCDTLFVSMLCLDLWVPWACDICGMCKLFASIHDLEPSWPQALSRHPQIGSIIWTHVARMFQQSQTCFCVLTSFLQKSNGGPSAESQDWRHHEERWHGWHGEMEADEGLLREAGHIYDQVVTADHFAVHPHNRSGTGISPFGMHRKAAQIMRSGIDMNMLRGSIAMEMSSCSTTKAKQLKLTQDLVAISDGLMGELTGKERFLTLSHGHFCQWTKALLQGVKTSEPSLQDATGHLARDQMCNHDQQLKTILESGWQWCIIQACVEEALPELPNLIQSAKNASNSSCVVWSSSGVVWIIVGLLLRGPCYFFFSKMLVSK